MLQGCGFESSLKGIAMVDEIEKKIALFSKKIGAIEDIEPINVLSYLKAAAELYPLAVKLREMAEADAVCGVEKMFNDVNSILKKLVEETGCPEDEFGGWEIPSHYSFFKNISESIEKPKYSEDWLEDIDESL